MCVELCLCGWQIYIAHSLYITHAHVWAYQMAYSKINWSKDATQRSSHFRNFAAIDFISPRTFCRHLFALATRRCASVEIPRLEIERGDKVKSTRANFHCRKIINSMCTSTIVCNAFFHFSSAKKKKQYTGSAQDDRLCLTILCSMHAITQIFTVQNAIWMHWHRMEANARTRCITRICKWHTTHTTDEPRICFAYAITNCSW